MELLDGVTTGTGTAVNASVFGPRLALYVIWHANCTAGQVIFETAATEGYAGTWHPLATFDFDAGKVNYQAFDGPLGAVRARVTTDVTGTSATVTVKLFEGGR